MVFKNFGELIEKVGSAKRKRVVVAAAHDEHTLEAVFEAKKKGIIDFLLVGNSKKICEICIQLDFDIDESLIIEASDDAQAAFQAVEIIRQGKGDFLMKGKMQTETLLKAVVDKQTGIRTDSIMSHVAILEVPAYHKIIAVTDGGMLTYPTLDQKKLIVINALNMFRLLGYEKPKVAVLAAVETVNEKMPETVDANELKKLSLAGDFGHCVVDGPLSFDLIMSQESVKIKGFDSPVACDADILIAPNIHAGNILSKCMILTGGAKMAGCIVGAKVPIVLTSRGATSEEKYLSLVLSAASCNLKPEVKS